MIADPKEALRVTFALLEAEKRLRATATVYREHGTAEQADVASTLLDCLDLDADGEPWQEPTAESLGLCGVES